MKALDQAADEAYAAMVEAVGDLHVAEFQAVESTVAGFKDAIKNVPGEATLGEVSANIQASAAAVQESVDALGEAASCGMAEGN